MAILKDANGNDVDVPTREELASIVEQGVGKHITGALRNQLPKILPGLIPVDDLAAKVGASLGLDEKFAAVTAALEGMKAAPPAPPKPDGQPAPRFEDSPAYKAQQQQLERLTQQLSAEKAEKAAERQKARTQTLRQRATETLTELGVTGVGTKHAFNTLSADGRIVYEGDASDEILFVDDKGEKLPLKDGLKAWTESEDAKVFLPPRGASGSGDEPRRSAGGPTRKGPMEYSHAEIGAALRSAMNGESQ